MLAARGRQSLEDAAQECRDLGAEAVAVPTDVAEEHQVADLVATTTARYGRIDVFVGNAALFVYGLFEQTPTEAFKRVVDTNLHGHVHAVKALLPHWQQRGEGTYVLVGSIQSLLSAPYQSAYVTSKHAALGLMDVLADEHQGTRIRFGAVLPSTIDTPIYQNGANYTGKASHPLPPTVSVQRAAKAVVAQALHPKRNRYVGRLQAALVPAEFVVPWLFHRITRPAVEVFALRGRQDPTDGNLYARRTTRTPRTAGGSRSAAGHAPAALGRRRRGRRHGAAPPPLSRPRPPARQPAALPRVACRSAHGKPFRSWCVVPPGLPCAVLPPIARAMGRNVASAAGAGREARHQPAPRLPSGPWPRWYPSPPSRAGCPGHPRCERAVSVTPVASTDAFRPLALRRASSRARPRPSGSYGRSMSTTTGTASTAAASTTAAEWTEWAEWHAAHEAARASEHGFLAITSMRWLTPTPERFDDLPGRGRRTRPVPSSPSRPTSPSRSTARPSREPTASAGCRTVPSPASSGTWRTVTSSSRSPGAAAATSSVRATRPPRRARRTAGRRPSRRTSASSSRPASSPSTCRAR